ncbi:hypothetical protein NEUTE2DRAFT_128716 [Neurospora tetrasperma FGSC 2509]|nr:hypothetical protein NEUTE2DRAFT_128716 [Neurospora tetrasperma FGSC 2509]
MTTNIPLGALALLLVALSSTSSVSVSAIPVPLSRDVIINGTTANTTVVPYTAPHVSQLSTPTIPSLTPSLTRTTNNGTDTNTDNSTITSPESDTKTHHHYDPSTVVENSSQQN